MNEKMIAGYAAYTTAEEVGVAGAGEAPATTPFFGISIAAFSIGVNVSYYGHC